METKENQVKTLSLLETSKLELNPYKEQIDQLLKDSENLVCPVDNKELFESVGESRKVIKALAIEIEKKDKSVISKFNDAKKDFREFSLSLSEPLRKREQEIKEIMQPYIDAKEEAKNAKRIAIEQEENRVSELANKVTAFHTDNIVAISECKTIADIEQIETDLEGLDISKETFQEKYAEVNFIRMELLKKIETEKGKITAYEAQQKELAELQASKAKEDVERERKDAIVGEIIKIKVKAMERLFDATRVIDLEDVRKTVGISINSFNFQEYSGEAKELETDLLAKIDNRISELTVMESQQKQIAEENERKAKIAKEQQIKADARIEESKLDRKKLVTDFDSFTTDLLTNTLNQFKDKYTNDNLLDQSTKDEIGMFIENFTEKITNREISENEIIYKIKNIDDVPAKYLHRTVNVELVNEAIKAGTKTIKGLVIGKRIDIEN